MPPAPCSPGVTTQQIADHADVADTIDIVLALIEPVVACVREQPESGRT